MAIRKGKIKKYIDGGSSEDSKRTVVKSDSKNYKTITKGDNTKIKRTVKGVLTGALSVKKTEANRAEYIKNAQKANEKAAQRISDKYAKQSDGGYLSYDNIRNQNITVPKTSKYGDYKKGGTIKFKKK